MKKPDLSQPHKTVLNNNLKNISNKELLSQTKLLVQEERNIHIQVLHHLREIQSRRLYLELGFSSLFDYATKELGYSEGAAFRRIKAMKLCQDVPDTEFKLQSGTLSLSSACQIQTFFEKHKKTLKEGKLVSPQKGDNNQKENTGEHLLKESIKESTKESKEISQTEGVNESTNTSSMSKPSGFFNIEEKQDLVRRVEGKSTRATLKLLSEISPLISVSQKEQVRFLGKGKVEIKVVIDESCHKQLEELRGLLSHKDPDLSYGKLLFLLSEEALKKYDPRKKTTRKPNLRNQVSKQTTLKKQVSSAVTNYPAETDYSAPKNHCVNKRSEEETYSAPKNHCVNNKDKKKTISAKQDLCIDKLIFLQNETSAEKQSDRMNPIKQHIRYISPYLKKQIWERDQGQCTYAHPKSKRRCISKHLLQIDHIRPFSLGGRTTLKNLRLLCAGHNQFRNGKGYKNEKNLCLL